MSVLINREICCNVSDSREFKKALYATFVLRLLFNYMTTKEDFLNEHNKLSPEGLQATIKMLNRFKEEKPALFKFEGWPLDKLRRPFIFWLTSFSEEERADML